MGHPYVPYPDLGWIPLTYITLRKMIGADEFSMSKLVIEQLGVNVATKVPTFIYPALHHCKNLETL